jgi:hypothetical protein
MVVVSMFTPHVFAHVGSHSFDVMTCATLPPLIPSNSLSASSLNELPEGDS